MPEFQFPTDLMFNRAMIQDPTAYAREAGCASWLFLVGDEFASMPGGISYAQVQAAVPITARVISDPPRQLTLELAREQLAVLDGMPRPTLVTCRAGPRSSATTYMYAGLMQGATPDEVIAAAELDKAPFCTVPENKEWVRSCMTARQSEFGAGRKGA